MGKSQYSKGPRKCGEVAIQMIDRLRFYLEQLSDPEIRKGNLGVRCLAFKECRDEIDQIEEHLDVARHEQQRGETCEAISAAASGLRSAYRVEGFIKGAELMEERR